MSVTVEKFLSHAVVNQYQNAPIPWGTLVAVARTADRIERRMVGLITQFDPNSRHRINKARDHSLEE